MRHDLRHAVDQCISIGGARAIDLAHDAAVQLHAPHLQLERSARQRRDTSLEQLGGAGSPRRVRVRRRRVPPGRRLHHFEDPRVREHGESLDARQIRREHVRQNAADALRIRQAVRANESDCHHRARVSIEPAALPCHRRGGDQHEDGGCAHRDQTSPHLASPAHRRVNRGARLGLRDSGPLDPLGDRFDGSGRPSLHDRRRYRTQLALETFDLRIRLGLELAAHECRMLADERQRVRAIAARGE